jgi:2-methylisocitrate lyase-like PEP mutase family enzyme
MAPSAPSSASPSASRRLRELIAAPATLVVPGAHDALSATLVEREGFDAVFVGDYNASAVLLGQPDYGLVTVAEMVDVARRITRVSSLPLIADAGAGFGNVLNVVRTVEEYQELGAAGMTIEDQVFPKRCGHMEGKQVIPAAEMEAKIRAAVHTRADADFVIIARTDTIATDGLEEAIERGRRYADAGADVFWPDAVPSVDALERLVAEVPLPLQLGIVEGGKTPHLNVKTLTELGVAIALCGVTTLYAMAGGIQAVLRALRDDGDTKSVLDRLLTFPEFNALVGLPAMQALERELAPPRADNPV